MPINDCPRLCGGVFLTYLLDARKQRFGVREHYSGDSDGLSDPEAFADLIRIISPNYTVPAGKTFKENTSSYKNCRKNAGTYIPLNGTAETRAFDECVRTDYQTALSRMLSFTDTYLETGENTKKDEYLVEALVEIISEDTSIEDDAEFYALEDGSTISKRTLVVSTHFCLQAFLIGIWHYILQNRPDNMQGRDTIESWKPTAGYTQKLTVKNCTVQETESPDSVDTTPEYAETIIEESTDEQAGAQKKMNTNQMVFIQNGDNSTQIGSVGTLTIKHGD